MGSFSAYGLDNLLSSPSHEGMDTSNSLLNTISFLDTRGHWAEPAIQSSAALSIMRGTGNGRFNPDQLLTNAQALAILVNSIGLEAEAQKLGEEQSNPRVRDLIVLNAAEDWAKGYIQAAIQNNIVTQEEVDRIINIPQDRAGAIETQVQNMMAGYENMTLDNAELAKVQEQVNELIQSGATWNRPTTREQVAVWVARALELEPVYGANIVKVYELSDWREIQTAYIPYVEAILQKNFMNGVGNGRFAPRGQFTRGQMAQVVSNIMDDILTNRGFTIKDGKIINIEPVESSGSTNSIITVYNNDGTQNHIVVEPPVKDVIVQKDGRLGLTNLLMNGDQIKYYIDETNNAVLIKVGKQQERKIEGFIDYISYGDKQIILTDFSNGKHTLEAVPNIQVNINGKSATFDDLLFGQEIEVILQGNRLVRVDGYLDEDPSKHGYITPGSKTKVGDVLFINSDSVEIKSSTGREKYKITDQTQILRSTGRAQLFEVKVGDRVILSFDDVYSPDVATIRSEDDERHIETVYRGVLDSVNPRRNEVILNDVSYYNNGTWTKHQSQKVTLKAEDNAIFDGNRNVSIRDIERATGTEVYVAVENSYGVPRAAKLLLKQGSTVIHESKISSIQFGTNQMIVDNNSINFHDGTIVVKNNRLVDMLNLDSDQTVYVVSDQLRSSRNSAFIEIEYDGLLDNRPGDTQLKIYRGVIEDIYDYSVIIGRLSYSRRYYQLENNQWVKVSNRQKLTLTQDTYIFDSQIKQEIPTDAFLDSRFIDPDEVWDSELRDRIEQGFYEDKAAYFVVKESTYLDEVYSEVLSINITPTISLNSSDIRLDHSAIGNVESIDLDQEQITLRNVSHWNTLNNRWEQVRNTERIDLSSTTILINDKPIDRDNLYKIKAGAKTYMVKVKNNSTGDDAYVLIIEQ